MSEKTRSVAKSVSVLSIAGILCKLIGVLFSIPLNMISTKVATDFYIVYPTYTLLLTISSAGLPVAVSRLVAGFLARSDRRNAWNTFKCALMTLFTIGLFFSLMMVLFNRILVNMVGVEETSAGYYAIAPCVLIVCVLSAFRGLFHQLYRPGNAKAEAGAFCQVDAHTFVFSPMISLIRAITPSISKAEVSTKIASLACFSGAMGRVES